jgi:hypothetical protein
VDEMDVENLYELMFNLANFQFEPNLLEYKEGGSKKWEM